MARSFAAADIVDGCLVVTGGDTELGPTDSVEIIGGTRESLVTNNHFIMTQARAAPGPGVTSLCPGLGQVTAWSGWGRSWWWWAGAQTTTAPPRSWRSSDIRLCDTAFKIYNLASGEWRNGSESQKDRALFGCSLLEVEGLGALVAAGNDFSPADLAEVK